MNENEFIDKWNAEKPQYAAWGAYVIEYISSGLLKNGKNLNEFLKIPVKYRLKENQSLLDKAFSRKDKNYKDPYNEIEDKVGARFVVLLIDDIRIICEIVLNNSNWDIDSCKHFDVDRDRDPLLFTYQSVHFVVRPKTDLTSNGSTIKAGTPCELQIRTLLQHAHAELTHDAIYKSKRTVKPKVHRIVAKSMALIETTDDFFSEATRYLNYGPLQEHNILTELDNVYFLLTNIKPSNQKSSLVIWDTFEQLIDENLINLIKKFVNKYEHIGETIKQNYNNNSVYPQSIVLFVYWMLKHRRTILIRDWPLHMSVLESFAIDMSVSLQVDS
ncbi:GTP pyrophosphokinase [Rheinheimera hassiensis]|uniref:GTP pyrophosphokinase n=1 Tax=Rheinheimera hassiensis TaxID=1193627 RepID=UPI001F064C05|nr:RelA/SpoT domain-containing protein [Rheinheimera hassiensis]